MRRGNRRANLVAALAAGLLLAACDSGPKGPGQLTGRMQSGPIPVGAIVLEFSGSGITGFSGSGSTRVFFSERASGVFRVVLVTPTPGEIAFQISVDDLEAPLPAVTVVEAVGGDNGAIANLTGIAVEVKP
jgi:hypothetical protein